MLRASDCDGLSDCIWSTPPRNNIHSWPTLKNNIWFNQCCSLPWGELLLSDRWTFRKEQQWTMWYLTFRERTQMHSRRCQIWSEAVLERITKLITQSSFHVLFSHTQTPWASSDGGYLSMLDLHLLRRTINLTMDLKEIFSTVARLWERPEWGNWTLGVGGLASVLLTHGGSAVSRIRDSAVEDVSRGRAPAGCQNQPTKGV